MQSARFFVLNPILGRALKLQQCQPKAAGCSSCAEHKQLCLRNDMRKLIWEPYSYSKQCIRISWVSRVYRAVLDQSVSWKLERFDTHVRSAALRAPNNHTTWFHQWKSVSITLHAPISHTWSQIRESARSAELQLSASNNARLSWHGANFTKKEPNYVTRREPCWYIISMPPSHSRPEPPRWVASKANKVAMQSFTVAIDVSACAGSSMFLPSPWTASNLKAAKTHTHSN